MTQPTAGFRLGVYVFKDAEIVDFTAPYGVLSVARRFDPEIDAFLIADAARPVQTQAGFTVLPNYSFQDSPAMDAFLIPGASVRGRKCTIAVCMPLHSVTPRGDAPDKRLHGLLGVRAHGFARRSSGDESQRSGSARSVRFWKAAARSSRGDRPGVSD